jgi:hypothetical protein
MQTCSRLRCGARSNQIAVLVVNLNYSSPSSLKQVLGTFDADMQQAALWRLQGASVPF